MRQPRAWTVSEVVVAARAILVLEREAANGRRGARWSGLATRSMNATEATAKRWGRGRRWLEQVLAVHDFAAPDSARFGTAVAYLERGGAAHLAEAWLKAVESGRSSPELAEPTRAMPILSADWRLSHVAIAAKALIAWYVETGAPVPGPRLVVPARRRGQILNHVAGLWSERGDWLRKVLDVCEGAQADPARFGFLVDTMDKAGRPQAAWTRMDSLHDEARVASLQPVVGRFHTLVFDVPWQVDEVSQASDHGYAQMSFEDILGLKDLIDGWAADDYCHLWFWAKNNSTGLAHRAVEHYGFEFKISHIWDKPSWGRGRWARNKHETVLLAVRGERRCKDAYKGTPTVHPWPRPDGPESTKPDGFYSMVESLSYGPYGEAFQRVERAGFVNLYQPAPVAIPVAAE